MRYGKDFWREYGGELFLDVFICVLRFEMGMGGCGLVVW